MGGQIYSRLKSDERRSHLISLPCLQKRSDVVLGRHDDDLLRGEDRTAAFAAAPEAAPVHHLLHSRRRMSSAVCCLGRFSPLPPPHGPVRQTRKPFIFLSPCLIWTAARMSTVHKIRSSFLIQADSCQFQAHSLVGRGSCAAGLRSVLSQVDSVPGREPFLLDICQQSAAQGSSDQQVCVCASIFKFCWLQEGRASHQKDMVSVEEGKDCAKK